MKVVAAVSELEIQYEGQATFTIISAKETQGSQDKIEEYGFTALKHGLVVFDADGNVAATMPGHQFGKDEIAANLLPAFGNN
ncbi:MAG: hypothetical protein ACI8X5_001965 [Planctomycetota bacterium]|jgi:hypothetical protein